MRAALPFAWGFLIVAVTVQPALSAQQGLDLNELARCAAISNSTERLGCYDALAAAALPGARNQSPPAGVVAGAGTQGSAAASAPATTGASPATGAAGANGTSAATSATASTNPDDPANFGLTPHQLKTTPKGPEAIKSIVSQMTEDRLNRVSLVLENGQVWTFTEPDPRVRPGDTVTIRKASLGSFLMTTPSRRSYRVERLK